MNQRIVDELTKSTISQADFSDVVGRWDPDEVFDKAIENQREVNLEDWTSVLTLEP